MYKQLEMYLDDVDTDCDSLLMYWDDLGYKDAVNVLDKFDDEDWEELFKNLDDKSINWKLRLADCLEDKDNQNEIKVVKKLLESENDDLFIATVDIVRIYFDRSLVLDNKEYVERIDRILPQLSEFTANNIISMLNDPPEMV